MRPPFNPMGSFPAPPQPMHDPRMVAAYLDWKKRQEEERRKKTGSAPDVTLPHHDLPQGGSVIPAGHKGHRWFNRIAAFFVLLLLVFGALVIIGGGSLRRPRPKPPKTVRSLGLINVIQLQ